MAELTVQVTTPECNRFTGKAQRVQLPGVMGQMGVLPEHTAMVTILAPGIVEVVAREGGKIFAVAEGFATIANNEVVCLVDEAVEADQIDVAKVTQRISELERVLAEDDTPRTRGQLAYLKAQLTLKG